MLRMLRNLLPVGLLLITLGCAFASQTATPAIPTADKGLELTPSATATPTVAATTAATATVPPTATPNPCPAVTAVAFPERPTDFGDSYIYALREYLSAGGNPATLGELLHAWEALPPDGGMPLQQDFTGDGSPEVVTGFINPLAESFPPEGMLAIFSCQNGAYETLYSYAPGEWTNIALVGGEDLNGNGTAELVFADVTCGAHTCWHTLHVWSWDGSTFREQMAGDPSLPYPTFTLTQDAILASSVGVGSVGAGPQRVYTETWSWDGSVITRTATQLGPAQYRYHAFRDGDEAFRAGRYAEALDAYVRVINDDNLEPWAGYYGAPEERLWFTALARWRLVLLGVSQGNFPDAESDYQLLQADFAAGSAGYPVAQLATRFWEAYQRLGLLPEACAEAVAAPEAAAVLEFLNSFGYANPTYTTEELCPLTLP
ncbi:MAG: hypothetical protein RBT75_00310 [Anaerolineae bacterium]|nr:hypothetical protein [Anaerolineae bacterium]